MHDFSHIPTGTGASVVQIFYGTSTAEGGDWQTWLKPRGKTMIDILLVGKGADGGTGAIGAGAGGGAGGGSGGQTRMTIPLALLPDVLYLSLMGVVTGSQLRSFISIRPALTAGAVIPAANDTLAMVYGGTLGGNAATTTGGTGGIAGAIATVGLMPLFWQYASVLAGVAGTNGGSGLTTGTAGAALTLPLTGQFCTGGTGGGGSPATAVNPGLAGGAITGAGSFATLPGGVGGSTATTPPTNGNGGLYPVAKLMYAYGGTGGGGTYDVATGGGLVQSSGGNGMPGCGGGGMGGAYTGSAAGNVGKGGSSYAVITCW